MEGARAIGINACMDQLRKFIETKAKALGDTEKLQLEKEKFEFNKYKTDIELQLNKDKLEIEKSKAISIKRWDCVRCGSSRRVTTGMQWSTR